MAITGKCAHCGAQIVFDKGTTVVKCDYCDSINVVQDFIKPQKQTTEVKTTTANSTQQCETIQEEKVLREVKPQVKFPANYNRSSINEQLGSLWINDEDVFFKPYKFNFGSLESMYLQISDIIGYTSKFDGNGRLLTFISRKKSLSVRVTNQDVEKILTQVETRRRKYYESKGLEFPTLEIEKCDDYCKEIVGLSKKGSYKASKQGKKDEQAATLYSIGLICMAIIYYFIKCS